MSIPNHTPGPWEVFDEINVRAVNGINRYICTCSGNARANAHLIAAAPDLLAALEAVVEDFGSHNLSVRTINTMIAAIDKAKGITE